MRRGIILVLMLAATPVFAQTPQPTDPLDNPSNPAKVALGKALFWEEQLSVTRTVACGTCHRSFAGGADPRADVAGAATRHPGPDSIPGNADDIGGSMGVPAHTHSGAYTASPTFGFAPQVGKRAAPSVINAAFAPRLLWDGRVRHLMPDPVTGQLSSLQGALENQALLPLVDPVEMGAAGDTLADVPARIADAVPLALANRVPKALHKWIGDRGYPQLFEEAFGSPDITAARIAMAIASYERSLVAFQAPSDLGSDALTGLQQEGNAVFLRSRCAICHAGTMTTDFRIRYIGVRPVEDDPGHFVVTGNPHHRGAMRTPSLRNVALRNTFMHNGRFTKLEDVIEFYNRGGDFTAPNKDPQIAPLNLTAQEKTGLLAFLHALTDPRVAAEAPPFDRPTLFTETDRVPRIVGEGRAGQAGVPRLAAIEPPLLGAAFTVTVEQARANASATLVVSRSDPGLAATTPTGDFATIPFTTDAAGRASIDLPLGADPMLDGTTLRGRIYLADPTATDALAITRAFEITAFRGDVQLFADDFE